METTTRVNLIVAVDSHFGIGKDNKIPWSGLPVGNADQAFFKRMTVGGILIMGMKTYKSLPHPLADRIVVVLTRNKDFVTPFTAIELDAHVSGERNDAGQGTVIFESDYERAKQRGLTYAQLHGYKNPTIWIAGGADIYNEALARCDVDTIYITVIRGGHGCDTHFPIERLDQFYYTDMVDIKFGQYRYNCTYKLENNRNGKPVFVTAKSLLMKLPFQSFFGGNDDEFKYIILIKKLLARPLRDNRTGVRTHGSFAEQLRFELCEQKYDKGTISYSRIIPLMTSKFTSFKVIYYELVWFLRGSTNTKFLTDNGITIWNGNSTREYLDSVGLVTYAPGDVGPIYGSQWRNWNGVGVDQMKNLIEGLKRDPWSRRHIVTAWNPDKIRLMALPSCHCFFQMYVEGDDKGVPRWLSCALTMRSCDVGCGLHYNIGSYSLLTHMIAQICGLTAKELVINMNDCHLYEKHVEGVKRQLESQLTDFPTLEFSDRITSKKDLTIDDFAYKFEFSDYMVHNYHPHTKIDLEMAV